MDDEIKSGFIKTYNETIESLKKAISQDDDFGKRVHFGEALGIRSCYAIAFGMKIYDYNGMRKLLDDAMNPTK